jgi:hypothetical protein
VSAGIGVKTFRNLCELDDLAAEQVAEADRGSRPRIDVDACRHLMSLWRNDRLA